MGGAKLDWFQFYARDWLCDPALMAASAASQGIWIRLLCLMFVEGRSDLTGDLEVLARWGHCSADEIARFMREASDLKFADVQSVTVTKDPSPEGPPTADLTSDATYTVSSRRFAREAKHRADTRERVAAHRDRKAQVSNRSVTPIYRVEIEGDQEKKGVRDSAPGSDPSSPDSSPPPASPSEVFNNFWSDYPRREKRQEAEKVWLKLSDGDRAAALDDLPKRIAANWAARDLKYIPLPTTYLNQKMWRDDLTLFGTGAPNRNQAEMNHIRARMNRTAAEAGVTK